MKIIAIICLCATSAFAALEWERKDIKLEVHPSQIDAVGIFCFTNVGDKPVSLSEVRVSCGCLSPKLAKRTFAAGEKGELSITFDLRNRTGHQEKSTTVQTSDGEEFRLMLTAEIPKPYSVVPSLMKWTPENAAATKTAKFVNQTKQPIKLISVSSSNAKVSVELKTIREGFEYEVVVSRPKAGKKIRAVVKAHAEPPPGYERAKSFKFYVFGP